jgi:hypothetical protein
MSVVIYLDHLERQDIDNGVGRFLVGWRKGLPQCPHETRADFLFVTSRQSPRIELDVAMSTQVSLNEGECCSA